VVRSPITKPILFSAWATVHLVAFAFLLRFTLVSVEAGGRLDYPTATVALNEFIRLRGLPISLGLWGYAALFMGALAIITVGLTCTFKKLLDWQNLQDVNADTIPAIIWGIKKLFTSGLIALPLLSLVAVFVESSLLAWLVPITWLVIPFAALNIASPHTASHWFSGWTTWPSFQTFLATLSIAFLILAFDYLLGEVPFGHWLIEIPINITAYTFAHLFVASVLMSIFIYHIPLKNVPNEFKSRANSRFILAWLVLDINALSLVGWFIPPLLLLAAYTIYVVPVAVDILNSLNQPRSAAFDLFIMTSDVIAKYWWLAAPSLWALWLVVAARFLVIYDNLDRYRLNQAHACQPITLTHK